MSTGIGKRGGWSAPLGRLAATSLALAIIAAWLLVAVVHLRDRFLLDHVSGAWIGLAYWAQQGLFYPPPTWGEEGVMYGGTRWGPIPIAMQAALAHLTGEPIFAGKSLVLAETAGMLLAMVAVLRRIGCAWTPAWLLAAGVLVTATGWMAGLTIRHDALPVAMQLLAMWLVVGMDREVHLPRWRGWGRWVWPAAAGVLCGAAVLAKASSVWGGLGLALWLAVHHRRAMPWLMLGGLVGAATPAAAAYVASDGRWLDNMRLYLLAGESAGQGAGRLTDAVRTVLYNLAHSQAAAWALVPAVVATAAVGLSRRRLSPIIACLATCSVTTAYVFTSPGVIHNHLLPLVVLLALAAGELAAGVRPASPGPDDEPRPVWRLPNPALHAFLILMFAWLAGSAAQTMGLPGAARTAAGVATGRSAGDPDWAVDSWRDVLPRAHEPVWAYDASLPIAMGRPPVVLDTFMLRRTLDRDAGVARAFVRRLEQREFAAVVLPPGAEQREEELTPAMAETLLRQYEPRGELWGHVVWRPAGVMQAAAGEPSRSRVRVVER